MIRLLPYCISALLFFLSFPVSAQLSGLARLLTMEGEAAMLAGRSGIFSSEMSNAARMSEYLSASRSYNLHMGELERMTGGSLNSRYSTYPEPEYAKLRELDRYFNQQFSSIANMNRQYIPDMSRSEIPPYLNSLFKTYAELLPETRGKSSLTREDSLLIIKGLYVLHSKDILKGSYFVVSANGGWSGGGNYPPTIYDDFYERRFSSRREEPEEEELDDNNDDDSDDDGDDDGDDDNDDLDSQDSTDDYHSDGSGNYPYGGRNEFAPDDDPGEKNGTSAGGYLLWILGLGYYLLSTAGIWRIFLKTQVPLILALVPFLRLGPLFRIAGYSSGWAALQLLLPFYNVKVWFDLNERLCGSFQCPIDWELIGILCPGLFWYKIGYSNKYYIGSRWSEF